MNRAKSPKAQFAFLLFQLDKKIRQLKRIVADLFFDKAMLRGVNERKFMKPEQKQEIADGGRTLKIER